MRWHTHVIGQLRLSQYAGNYLYIVKVFGLQQLINLNKISYRNVTMWQMITTNVLSRNVIVGVKIFGTATLTTPGYEPHRQMKMETKKIMITCRLNSRRNVATAANSISWRISCYFVIVNSHLQFACRLLPSCCSTPVPVTSDVTDCLSKSSSQ